MEGLELSNLEAVVDVEPLRVVADAVGVNGDSAHSAEGLVEVGESEIFDERQSVRILKDPAVVNQRHKVPLWDRLGILKKIDLRRFLIFHRTGGDYNTTQLPYFGAPWISITPSSQKFSVQFLVGQK